MKRLKRKISNALKGNSSSNSGSGSIASALVPGTFSSTSSSVLDARYIGTNSDPLLLDAVNNDYKSGHHFSNNHHQIHAQLNNYLHNTNNNNHLHHQLPSAHSVPPNLADNSNNNNYYYNNHISPRSSSVGSSGVKPQIVNAKIASSYANTTPNGYGGYAAASRTQSQSQVPAQQSASNVHQLKTWSLSDSMNHLAEKLAADGIIVEEYNAEENPSEVFCPPPQHIQHHYRNRPVSVAGGSGLGITSGLLRSIHQRNHVDYFAQLPSDTGNYLPINDFHNKTNNNYANNNNSHYLSASSNHHSNNNNNNNNGNINKNLLHSTAPMPNNNNFVPFFVFRNNSKKYRQKEKKRVKSWNASRFLFQSHPSSAVVHESSALGSDGESLEVSPCTSDQMSTSSLYPNGNDERCYVPNVKMRQKPQNRQWSEQDIQKRLSLPADIKLPQTVIDKLNRTPTLNNPLTRKSRRASLSEIGFGKLETYKKFFNLGEGTYATVYFGKSLLTGKSVALKEIRLEHEEGAPCTAIREVSLLRNLRHANVVTLHDVIYTERVLTLVFEYVQYDLREYMEKVDEIYVNNVKLFLMQLLRGLAYCHKRRILHRDLKPQNLLINHCGELKLADFGLARAQSVPTKTYSNEVVTLWYRPPDVLLGSTDYSTHIDMWGVGCILYEMLMHKAMFPGCTTDDQLNLIFRRLGTPTRETCPALFELTQAYRLKGYARFSAKSLVHPPRINADRADLLQKLLRYDGTKRILAEEAMRHKILDFFPATIFSLADTESVLSLPKIYYVREQSWKSGGYMRSLMEK